MQGGFNRKGAVGHGLEPSDPSDIASTPPPSTLVRDRAGVFPLFPIQQRSESQSVVRVLCHSRRRFVLYHSHRDVALRGTRCKRRPPSFNSLSGRIHGLRTEICLCKRKTMIRHHSDGSTTSRSVVRLSARTRHFSDPPHSPQFRSDASHATCAPSILVDHPCSPPPTYTKILRMVRYPPAHQLYPNVPRVHITHSVPRPRSWTSLVPRRRRGRRRNQLGRSPDGTRRG